MMITNWLRNKVRSVKAALKEDFTKNRLLTAEQRDRKRERAVRRISVVFMVIMMMSSLFGITAFADDTSAAGGEGVDTFNTVVQFIVDWVARIGLVIGFIGAIQFALGFTDDSAGGKTRGLMCLASGFIVFAVAKAYNMFTM